ncbi:MAG: helix-turn-helix domain-containing protein [Cytophagales bacterium]
MIKKLKNIYVQVDKWLSKANSYMYNFKDGHFQFPYVTNTPELMIEALKNTPFVTHNEQMQLLETNSSFMRIKLKYLYLEEGFWFRSTQSVWKVNVLTIAMPIDTPCDYYFLNYSRNTDYVRVVTDNSIYYENNSYSWTLYKADTAINAYFKKKCKSLTYSFMFNENWIEKNILSHSEINIESIKQLLNDENAYKTYIYNDKSIHTKFSLLNSLIEDKPVNAIDMQNFNKQSKAIILGFFREFSASSFSADAAQKLKSKDRTKLELIEKLLIGSLTTGFEGIEKISKKFEISPTKLKTDFKSAFGMSMLQYYQTKQMELAVEMLKNKTKIQDIAQTLGYENHSKFSSRFKEIIGVLPSKFI